MEEVSTEETSEELITEEEPVVALEGEEGLLGATSHKACASCQANLTLTMHTNNSSWYQSIVNNRVTAKNHALNDGYSGACASFVSYLLIDAGISGVSATPSCENLYSQLKNGAGGYTEIMLLWLVSHLTHQDSIHHLLMREILLILHLVLIYPKSPERYIARTISIPHGSL